MHTRAADYLRDHGLKATAPRVAIVAVLLKEKRPLSVQDLLDALPKKTADQATAYRSLEAFAEAGLIHRLDLGQGKALYELSEEGEHHHHLVCTSCGKIEDVEDCEVEAFARRALEASKRFAELHHHSLELFGICKDCVKKR